jgi:uncharacterized LabA/DUF88 family protein
MQNIAFIDGQNLHLGTQEAGWSVDLKKLRIYLRDKLKVEEAYYFLGHINETNQNLYTKLQKSGFIILFKDHHANSISTKKGNVDTDIVFEIMKSLIEEKFNKVVLVSGDGDYNKLVKYLVSKNKFEKILFPNYKFASSLYKELGAKFWIDLGRTQIKDKIKRGS